MARLNPPGQDIQRLREEYARRASLSEHDDRYRADNPAYQWMISRRRDELSALLNRRGITDLSRLKILEVGCGSGGVMREFLALGAERSRMFGIDLLPDRLRAARAGNLALNVSCADGQSLPFAAGSFDLALQFTAFSSILDSAIKKEMAAEILRVLKPEGALLWYDFWWNPLNPQTKGIHLREIRRLFPNCALDSLKLTLAPPISRRLLPQFSRAAASLEQMRFLNTHYLVLAWRKP